MTKIFNDIKDVLKEDFLVGLFVIAAWTFGIAVLLYIGFGLFYYKQHL